MDMKSSGLESVTQLLMESKSVKYILRYMSLDI